MVTGVVPATTSPMSKLILRNFLGKQCNTTEQEVSPPPPLGSVGVLYVLPWILAVVGGIAVVMPSLVMPQ